MMGHTCREFCNIAHAVEFCSETVLLDWIHLSLYYSECASGFIHMRFDGRRRVISVSIWESCDSKAPGIEMGNMKIS